MATRLRGHACSGVLKNLQSALGHFLFVHSRFGCRSFAHTADLRFEIDILDRRCLCWRPTPCRNKEPKPL